MAKGRLVASERGIISELERGGQVVLRYTTDNYNGSEGAIAGSATHPGGSWA